MNLSKIELPYNFKNVAVHFSRHIVDASMYYLLMGGPGMAELI
jgi:hypothetical protein